MTIHDKVFKILTSCCKHIASLDHFLTDIFHTMYCNNLYVP